MFQRLFARKMVIEWNERGIEVEYRQVVRVLNYSQTYVKVHRKPPLYINGEGPMSVKDNYDN